MPTSERALQAKCLFVAWVMLAVAIVPAVASAQKLVILVRHAERADGGAGGMAPTTDPALSAAGEARAAKLATMLADAGISAIYATEFVRTRDTAEPLAAKLSLPVRSMPARDTAGLVATLAKDHADDVVLVVGHSNSVPGIIKALGGPDVTIADSEHDNIFIVVPRTGVMTRIRY